MENYKDCGSMQEQRDNTHQSELRRLTTATDLPEHLQALYAASSAPALIQISICCFSYLDLGFLTAVTHRINTGVAGPVCQPVRRIPLGFKEEEERHLNAMIEAGVVTPSTSKLASPVVLVHKRMKVFTGVSTISTPIA